MPRLLWNIEKYDCGDIINSILFPRPARGHYVYMKKTNRRSGFIAKMETDFLYFHDSCLQFSYYFIGNPSEIKIIIALMQEVSFSL